MEKSFVTLEQNVCPICTKVFETGNLLMDTRIRNGKLMETFDKYTVTGYSICEECQKMIDEGRVALVEINEPSDPNNLTLDNVDRTGKIGWMKRDIVQQLIPEFPEDKFMCYVENGFFKEMEE